MNSYSKYILLYTIFLIALVITFIFIDDSRDRNIKHQQNILIQEARTHFQSQSNTRKWNDQYLGVYVRSSDLLKPHPYLPNSIVTTDDNETLFRVNHASMARQLSKISTQKEFKFHLTSLNPLNPVNKAGDFEKRALNHIETHDTREYYEFNDASFRYLGAILTEAKCLECHAHQGYDAGDIRGGLSVTLNNKNYMESISEIKQRNLILKTAVFIFLSLIAFLMHKQMQSNEFLSKKVQERTKQINETKNLLQNVLDTDKSLMMVSSGTEVILANKTILDFLDVASLDEFRLEYEHISDIFEELDDETYLQKTMNGEHWIDYLQREQHNQSLKVMINRHGKEIHFSANAKEISVNNQMIHIIVFDDITNQLKAINALTDKATKDTLTGLFNKGKFNDVLVKEIALSKATSSPLSLIFLDIDYFKAVNDTYGHDVGDYVLIELAKILQATVRKGDFVGRWGGEEFVITLQVTTAEQAAILAEKIRQKVESYNFTSGGKQNVSLGITQYKEGDDEKSFLKRVDEALYEAKSTGRNKFVIR